MFLCLLRKQFHDQFLSVLTNASSASCKNSGSVKILNVFSGGSNASDSKFFVLCTPPIFLSSRKLKFLEALQCELGFLRWFSPSLQGESRSLFNGCESQSKKIHVLFAISEPLLEYGTIQKSSEKYIKPFC